MNIGILGTGAVGKAFASRLSELGHEVKLGTRDPQQTLQKKDAGSVYEFLQKNKKITLGSFAEASAFGEMIINVCKGSVAMEVIRLAGEKNLAGKTLIDITNPLDFSRGMPPSLIPEYSNTTSLAEEIQKIIPDTKVVKTLNTMWNGLMINPSQLANGDHVNYICGNDEGAKSQVKGLLKEFGWRTDATLDLGDLSAARATEATLPIWLRVYGAKKTGAFNFRIVSQS
jgi:8-hydroxy-5-deazaflavin:NADPH oxidoreductase